MKWFDQGFDPGRGLQRYTVELSDVQYVTSHTSNLIQREARLLATVSVL